MDILAKFKKGAENHTYQRIDSQYKTDIFLGYNDDGQMSMVITEPGSHSNVRSSKYINVALMKREDGKMALSFDLLEDTYKSLFIIFCKDIISVCENAGKSRAVESALKRWKYWKNMFGKRKSDLLDTLRIKGLIGELFELKNHFMEIYDEATAINAWMGPLLGHKDFEIDNTWYEVKSITENAVKVDISSLEQLDSENDGHLAVIRLEPTSTVNSNAINLNSVILSVSDMIVSPEIREQFMNKLDNAGYTYDEEYKKYCFLYKGTEYYCVNNKFPRLTRANINKAIGNAQYTILLAAIADLREGK